MNEWQDSHHALCSAQCVVHKILGRTYDEMKSYYPASKALIQPPKNTLHLIPPSLNSTQSGYVMSKWPLTCSVEPLGDLIFNYDLHALPAEVHDVGKHEPALQLFERPLEVDFLFLRRRVTFRVVSTSVDLRRVAGRKILFDFDGVVPYFAWRSWIISNLAIIYLIANIGTVIYFHRDAWQ